MMISLDESPPQQCSICLGDLESPINLCVDDHESCCRECAENYIESQVTSAFFGTCPCISCPSLTHQKSKSRKVLLFSRWNTITKPETSTKYKALASHLLAFLCGGCHTLKTLDVGFEPDVTAEPYTKIEKLLTNAEGNSRYSELRTEIANFCLGEKDLETFYSAVNGTFFPQLAHLNDSDAWNIFVALLKTIEEPERRCNLHLRYLRDRPRMKTLCCNREHCFKCKIKDFHEGKSCLEYSSNLDNSIVTCPSCGIALARGDGCNTITCVCGKQFSWSAEKENTERSFAFRGLHPQNTSDACASILCTQANSTNSSSTMILQAKAWQIRNRIEVNRALRGWFKTAFSPFPSQMCSKLIPDRQPDGVREAIDLWKLEFGKEVSHCKSQNDIAISSIFTTAFPVSSERPVAAHLLTAMTSAASGGSKQAYDQRLITSASRWIETHREEFKFGVEQWELRTANQFLFLYGQQPFLSFKVAHHNVFCVQRFNCSISNSDLSYSNGDATAMRPGSASCYPAAFADLTGDRCMFRVSIDEAPRSSNWLTFGLAKRGMAASSSDGVGRTANSWGLSDDRSSTSSQMSVSGNGSEVTQFRKLLVGDILSAIVDVREGWLEVSLNDAERVHRFSIPPGAPQDYVFAMTFANDHRVTIICDGPLAMFPSTNEGSSVSKCEPGFTYLNQDHTNMYNNFKKQLGLILSDADETNFGTAPNSDMITDGSMWFKHCESSRNLARSRVELILPVLESLLHVRHSNNSSGGATSSPAVGDVGVDALQRLSAKMVLDAVSWYRLNRDQIYEDRKSEMAMNFSLIHGESAPFIAAMTTAQHQQAASSVSNEDVQAAIAYMKVFSEEMQEWYDIDMVSGDPLVEHIAKGCRCLPRHLRTCPNAHKQK